MRQNRLDLWKFLSRGDPPTLWEKSYVAIVDDSLTHNSGGKRSSQHRLDGVEVRHTRDLVTRGYLCGLQSSRSTFRDHVQIKAVKSSPASMKGVRCSSLLTCVLSGELLGISPNAPLPNQAVST
jgi:hypothetical protein